MKKALITGASAGIGLEFAYQLAQKNYDLILVSRNQQKLDEIAQDISSKHKNINEVLVADLSTQEGIDLVTNKIKSNQDIEFIVNNAGLGINKPFHKASLNEESDLLNVLVKAPLEITHSAITSMLNSKRGFIINVGSVAEYVPLVVQAATDSSLMLDLLQLGQPVVHIQQQKFGLLHLVNH